jgi:predicted HD phosphohydrolase
MESKKNQSLNILKLRQKVAVEAAKLLYDRLENDYQIAKEKALQFLDLEENSAFLPQDHEVRMEILKIGNLYQSYQEQQEIHESDYDHFFALLAPLEEISGGFRHPEGDFLYHSLQVFERAKLGSGYDFDFLLSALLHDVGQAVDPKRHAEAGAYLLEGLVSERVLFLVRYHEDAFLLRKRKLGQKRKTLLQQSPYLDDLFRLVELDQKGRESGVEVCSIEEALQYLQDLENEWIL